MSAIPEKDFREIVRGIVESSDASSDLGRLVEARMVYQLLVQIRRASGHSNPEMKVPTIPGARAGDLAWSRIQDRMAEIHPDYDWATIVVDEFRKVFPEWRPPVLRLHSR